MTRRPQVPIRRPLILILLLALLTPTVTASAQGDTPAEGRSVVYLPSIQIAPAAMIEFATEINRATDEPANPAERFTQGLDLIYVAWRMQGFQGHQYRLDFTIADGRTVSGSTRTATSNDYRDWTAFCLTTAGSCESGRIPLPAGRYTAQLFIDGQLYSEREAVIE